MSNSLWYNEFKSERFKKRTQNIQKIVGYNSPIFNLLNSLIFCKVKNE